MLKLLLLFLVGFSFCWIIIDNIFFNEMIFIQSKVYPHLYFIKKPLRNKDSLKKNIKAMVVKKMNTEFIGNEDKYKYQYEGTNKTIVKLDYNFSFMEYYKGWGSSPIGEAGTAHFIENKEDPGGFSSEYLYDYRERFQICEMSVKYCKNDTINYNVVINFYENGDVIERDTLINLCK